MKNKRVYKSLLIFVCFFNFIFAYAQQSKLKESTQTGFYSFPIPLNLSMQQARDLCIQKAKVNAIENAFGSVVMEGNASYTVNKTTGDKLESNSTFNSISDVYVSGEWIEDLSEPIIDYKIIGNENWISTTVKGRVRELKKNPIMFKAKTLVCPKINCEAEQFKNEQDFYLHFKSPIDGYLSVYLDVPEESTTYRLLPYKSKKEMGSFQIKADKDYFLFNDSLKSNNIDEYTLTLTKGNESESNKLFVLFNPEKPIEKPILSNVNELPLSISSNDFQKWLQTLRKYNVELQVEYKYLTISK